MYKENCMNYQYIMKVMFKIFYNVYNLFVGRRYVLCVLFDNIFYVYNLFCWQFICFYVFYLIVYFMGMDVFDCCKVVELVGIKIFINEFLVYKEFFVFIVNKKNFMDYIVQWNLLVDWYYQGDDIVLLYVN